MNFLPVILNSRALCAKSYSLGLDSASSLFLHLFFVVLADQVKKTDLQWPFFDYSSRDSTTQKGSSGLKIRTSFFKKNSLWKCNTPFLNITTVERSDSLDLRDILTTTYKFPNFSSAFRGTPGSRGKKFEKHWFVVISVINQLDTQPFLFYNKFISCLYMFRAHVPITRRSNCITQPLVSSHL